jgi:hypothetical protein
MESLQRHSHKQLSDAKEKQVKDNIFPAESMDSGVQGKID